MECLLRVNKYTKVVIIFKTVKNINTKGNSILNIRSDENKMNLKGLEVHT